MTGAAISSNRGEVAGRCALGWVIDGEVLPELPAGHLGRVSAWATPGGLTGFVPRGDTPVRELLACLGDDLVQRIAAQRHLAVVVERHLPEESGGGAHVTTADGVSVIFLDVPQLVRRGGPAEVRATAAHELGHHLTGPCEDAADWFAASIGYPVHRPEDWPPSGAPRCTPGESVSSAGHGPCSCVAGTAPRPAPWRP